MPTGLKRHHDTGFSHFITCSCYRHMPFLGRAEERDQCLRILRETAEKYQARLRGFVIMPEHIHLLIGEPGIANPSRVMQVLKQRVSLQCLSKKRPDKQDLLIFDGQLPLSFWLPRSCLCSP